MWQTSAKQTVFSLLTKSEQKERKVPEQQESENFRKGCIGNKDFLLTDIGNWYRGNDCERADGT